MKLVNPMATMAFLAQNAGAVAAIAHEAHATLAGGEVGKHSDDMRRALILSQTVLGLLASMAPDHEVIITPASAADDPRAIPAQTATVAQLAIETGALPADHFEADDAPADAKEPAKEAAPAAKK